MRKKLKSITVALLLGLGVLVGLGCRGDGESFGDGPLGTAKHYDEVMKLDPRERDGAS